MELCSPFFTSAIHPLPGTTMRYCFRWRVTIIYLQDTNDHPFLREAIPHQRLQKMLGYERSENLNIGPGEYIKSRYARTNFAKKDMIKKIHDQKISE